MALFMIRERGAERVSINKLCDGLEKESWESTLVWKRIELCGVAWGYFWLSLLAQAAYDFLFFPNF